ncbi:MAG: hypothetical protein RIT45_1517 [Pseudomonadota bacterium]|jgi:hypothetical protein
MIQVQTPSTGADELVGRLDAAIALTLTARRSATADVADGLALCGDLLGLCARDRAAYEALVRDRRPAIGLWLWRLALAVAAAGWPAHGLGLLDALPGVLVDGAAREVIAQAFYPAVEPTPLQAVGGAR